jgi:tetratricopeptide (TPR) repeat protein
MTKHFFDSLSYYILLLLTFLIPIFFVPASFISIQYGTSLLFAFGVVLALIFYIIAGLVHGSIHLPSKSRYIISFIFVVPAIYLLAGISSGLSRASFFGYTFDIATIGFILLGFIYLFLVSILFREKSKIFYSYLAFVFSSFILSLFLIVRMIWGQSLLSFNIFTKITTTVIGSWNNVSIFFAICLILSFITLEMVQVSKITKVFLGVAAILSLFFLILINFKIVWITLSVLSFVFILYKLFDQSRRGGGSSWPQRLKKIPIYSLVIFLVSIIFSVWSMQVGGYISQKLSISDYEVRPSFSITMDIAKSTISSKPFFGSGPNSFINQWLIFRPDDVLSTVFWNVDFNNGIGLIPTFAITTGILGILSWILFFSFYLYLGVKSIFSHNEDLFVKYLLASSFFVSLFLWIMAFIYVPSIVIFILTLLFTGLFLASAYLSKIILVETKEFYTPLNGFVFSLSMITALLFSFALLYGLYKNSVGLWYYQRSYFAINNDKNADLSEKYINIAINNVPVDVYYRALSEIELVRLTNLVSKPSGNSNQVQKKFSDILSTAIKSGLSAKDADSTNYLNWVSLGKVYDAISVPELNISGAYSSAELAYNEALKRNPKNPGILVLLARLTATNKDYKKAEDYAIEATKIKPNYLDAYFILSQIEVANNNINKAIDAVTASSVIDPTNPATFFQLGLLKYNLKDYIGAINSLEHAIYMAPDYANAKYFLGLSYEARGDHDKAIKEFEDLKASNPDNKDVETILSNLISGKSLFANAVDKKPEKGKSLPVKEKQ